ncbi:Ig-like domain-containing protein [Enterobacter hormaechei]
MDDGSHTLTVTATDPAGNESTPSAGITIVVDTVSTTPVITSVTDNAGNAATPVPSGDPNQRHHANPDRYRRAEQRRRHF